MYLYIGMELITLYVSDEGGERGGVGGGFFLNDTATTEIYTRSLVGSVRCV